MRIDDNWYDCTAWRHSHPGGALMCDEFHEKDATDAFYSLHSKEAIKKLKRMKALPLKEGDGPRDQVSYNFEKLTKQLEADGWYKRNWFLDVFRDILPVVILLSLGVYLSTTYPVLATFLIGFGMQQSGWLAHDFTHGRGKVCRVLAIIFGGVNGFSVDWWSNKHNHHHIFPNRKFYDSDIHNEPVIFLWVPKKSEDTPFRPYQHYYFLFAYSLLYVSWRLQSLRYALGSRSKLELAVIALNYSWLIFGLPWKVSLGSIIVGGFFVAVVVTANHQTEEMIDSDDKYNYIVDQYRSTRGVRCDDLFFEFFFGGMQYQLEHHLLPMVPRYRYPQARPLLKKFSEENGLPFHVNGIVEIAKLNFAVMKDVASKPALDD
ncbi:delta8 fatty acid desaturase-like protein [Strigomonas culicis]|uniref:Delta8 fatty acid desaturase-like protein n=1 Tax=Strigomonas culicis TaxID=28005 RepID=S9UJD6_9TRYP|nr:delta8 fatty acid desaturase-like protein [Strigomonas culicis]|eukprot:EPY30927.1 delta8 fatty acid desaturase-like protein [Strigomonas culicis]